MKINKILSFVLAFIICFAAPLSVNPIKAFAEDEGMEQTYVAKVGDTSYATIEEAIANWTDRTTLTLLADVTLSSTIQLSSKEYHILDLSTYTISYPSKTAIQINPDGRTSASYALDIKADATNPGGITASTAVKTVGKSGVKDRPIIRFYNGVFNGNISHSGSNNTNSPSYYFYGGIYHKTLSFNRVILQIHGGEFNGSLSISPDSSSYTLISGGRFKNRLHNSFGSALNKDKFTIGSAKGVYDRAIYVDSEGYLNVVATLPESASTDAVAVVNEVFTASKYDTVSNDGSSDDYFAYSSVANGGDLYFGTHASVLSYCSKAVVKFLKTSAEPLDITSTLQFDLSNGGVVPADVLNLTTTSSKVIMTFAEGTEPNLTVNPYTGNSDYIYDETENTVDGITTRTYSMKKLPPIAKIGSVSYTSLEKAVDKAEGKTITLTTDVTVQDLVIDKNLTFDLAGKTLTFEAGLARTATAGLQLANGKAVTIKNGTIVGGGLDVLVQNFANLTLENVILDGSNVKYALSNEAGETLIKDSTITAASDGIAFDIRENQAYGSAKVTVENSTINGFIELTEDANGAFTGSLVNGGVVHTLSGNYVQLPSAIERLDEFALTLSLSKDAIRAGESVNATISIDKDCYSAEYTFTYDTAFFSCDKDTDNDGVIYTFVSNVKAGDLVTYELVAKNDLTSVKNTTVEVNGNVVQYVEQVLNDIENDVTGDSKEIKISLNYTTEIHADYVQGYSLVLVKGADLGYVYDGVQMFYVKAYEAFAVIVYGAVTEDMVDAKLAKADSACKIIVKSYDVNCEYVAGGKVDIKDATAVYACTAIDFAVADYMELFLRADVDNNHKVNMRDVNEVTSNYSK